MAIPGITNGYNHVWKQEQLHLRLPPMDECSRKALWTQAHSNISAKKLIETLDQVVAWRGAPAYIRCDNGPEIISSQLEAWSDKHQVELRRIQPGKPRQNGLIERLNKTLRMESLNLSWFKNFA
jgi:putative transposase